MNQIVFTLFSKFGFARSSLVIDESKSIEKAPMAELSLAQLDVVVGGDSDGAGTAGPRGGW